MEMDDRVGVGEIMKECAQIASEVPISQMKILKTKEKGFEGVLDAPLIDLPILGPIVSTQPSPKPKASLVIS